MNLFSTISPPTRRLLKRAVEDEAFRAELFANRDSLVTTYEIPQEDNAVLQRELFGGMAKSEEFEAKLTGYSWGFGGN